MVADTTLDKLRPSILSALDQAQKSTSSHRKNIVILYKLWQRCLNITERSTDAKGRTSTRLVGEKAFLDALLTEGVNRVLVVKRGVLNADRCIKFICALVAHAAVQSGASLHR